MDTETDPSAGGGDQEIDSLPFDLPEDASASYDPARSMRAPIGLVDGSAIAGASVSEQMTATRVLGPSEGSGDQVRIESVDESGGGPVKLLRTIGVGGFGEVWEAVQGSLGRLVAVKKLRRDRVADAGMSSSEAENLREMFVAEAITAGYLEHPNILPIYDLAYDETGAPLIAMKRVRGTAWDALLARDLGSMDYEEYLGKHLPILEDVARAVAFAHSRGVIHRDLKTSQVMVGEFGEVLLMDWGLAVIFDAEATESEERRLRISTVPVVQSASSPAGTPAYMAPEQTRRSSARIGPWTDVYLLGGILYRILSGKHPHPGPGREATWRQAQRGHVPPLREVAGHRGLDAELVALVEAALKPSIPHRMQTSAEFLAALRDNMTGAGRRRQCAQLVAEAERALQGGRPDYETLSRCREDLRRAQALWPKHQRAEELSKRVLELFAQRALDEGDLQLAKVQVSQLASGDAREKLTTRVSEAEARVARNVRTRRLAVRFSFASLLIIIVGGGALGWRLYGALGEAREQAMAARLAELDALQQQRATVRQQRETLEARNDAIATLFDVVMKIAPKLEQFGDRELYRSVLEVTDRYVRKQPDELKRSKDLVRSLAGVVERFARMQAEDGDLKGALESYNRYLELDAEFEGLDRAGQREFRQAIAASRLADILERQGKMDDALASYQQAAASMDEHARLMGATDEVHIRLATYRRRAALLLVNMGRADEALHELELAEPHVQANLDDGTQTAEDFTAAQALALARADIHEARHEWEAALSDAERAVELVGKAVEMAPGREALRRSLSRSQRREAKYLHELGRDQEAETVLEESLVGLLGLERSLTEPTPNLLAEMAYVYSQRAELRAGAEKYEEALVDLIETEKYLRQAMAKQPEGIAYPGSLAWNLYLRGQYLEKSGQPLLAREAWRQGAELAGPLAADSEHLTLKSNAAYLYFALDDFEHAYPLLVELSEKDPSPTSQTLEMLRVAAEHLGKVPAE